MTRAIAFARLKPWEQRQRKQQDLVAEINRGLSQIPGIRLFATNPPSLGGGGASSRPVEFVLRSSEPYEQIKGYVDQLIAAVQGNPGADQCRIRPDPRQAADQGRRSTVSGRPISASTSMSSAAPWRRLLGGRQVTRFNMNGEQYDVVIQVAGEDRNTPQALQTIYLVGRGGAIVQLSSLVKVEESVAPKELIRFNQLRSATITAVPAPGYSLGDALAVLEADSQARAADDGADRLFRPEPRVQAVGLIDRAGLPAGAGLHLSGAGGAVRELHRSDRDHGLGAALAHRGAGGAVFRRAAR